MGPRSHERGNPARADTSLGSPFRFNGAAFSRTRETRSANETVDQRGEASMGPRSHERGNENKRTFGDRPTGRLQWGRVLTNAETRRLSLFRRLLLSLLQWGRVLTNAETKIAPDLPARRSPGFNGAAFSRTRKHTNRLYITDIIDMLQWGRVLTNAETTRSGAARFALPTGFNGAAFSRTRKLLYPAVAAQRTDHASMGPRSHERGNTLALSCPDVSVGVASMGPRSHERGNGIAGEESLDSRRRFNGAAFSRTRKLDRTP